MLLRALCLFLLSASVYADLPLQLDDLILKQHAFRFNGSISMHSQQNERLHAFSPRTLLLSDHFIFTKQHQDNPKPVVERTKTTSESLRDIFGPHEPGGSK